MNDTANDNYMEGGSPLRRAIAKIMEEVGSVAKDGRNAHQNYNYAAHEDISAALQPLLAKHGVIIVPHVANREVVQNSVLVLDVDFYVSHISGEVLTKLDEVDGRRVPLVPRYPGAASFVNSKGGVDDKAFNKAVTAASKYFDIRFFKIPTVMPDADNDPEVPARGVQASGYGGGNSGDRIVSIAPVSAQAPDGPPRSLPLMNALDWEAVRAWGATFAAAIKGASTEDAKSWTALNWLALDAIKGSFPMAYDRLKAHVEAKGLEMPTTLPAMDRAAVPKELFEAMAACKTKRALDNVWQTQIAGKHDDAALEVIAAEFKKHEDRLSNKRAA